MRILSDRIFRRVGGSTGTNFFGLCWIASKMIEAGQAGSLVSIICDSGGRYGDTYYSEDWVASQGLDLAPWTDALERFLNTGRLDLPSQPS